LIEVGGKGRGREGKEVIQGVRGWRGEGREWKGCMERGGDVRARVGGKGKRVSSGVQLVVVMIC